MEDGSGEWSWTVLACANKPNQPTPKVTIHQGDLKLHRGALDDATFLQFHTINGGVAESGTGEVLGKNPLESSFTAQCGYCESLKLAGFIDRRQGQIVIGGTIQDLNMSADLAAKLPTEATALLAQLSGLTCKASALFRVQRSSTNAPWTFASKVN